MPTIPPFNRAVLAGVAVAFVAAVFVHLRAGPDPAWANGAWTLSSLIAVAGATTAWRHAADDAARAGWRWTALGCGVDSVAQLYADYFLLFPAANPPAAIFDDLLVIAVQPFFVVAAWHFLRRWERRRADLEIVLDTILLTLLVAAVALQYYVTPLAEAAVTRGEQIVRVLFAAGGGAIVWLVLVQLLRQTRFPRDPEGIALLGLVAYGVTTVVEAVATLPSVGAGTVSLDLSWHVALGLVATGGALAPSPPRSAAPEGVAPMLAPRLVVVVVGWIGITWMITEALGRDEGTPALGALLIIGVAVLAIRFSTALLEDRRYATRLERAVERQTRSLSESLSATAAAEHALRLLMEAVPDAIVVLDPEGRVLELNSAARALVKAPAEQASGRPAAGLVDTTAPSLRDTIRRAVAGETVSFEAPFLHEDGSPGTQWVSYAPVREGDEVAKVIGVFRDVTQQRRTEAQLQRAERLASLGQLVSGVAHEINNPAAIIAGFAQTLLLEPLSDDHRDMVRTMYDEAIRIGGITTNLLAFARGSGTSRTLVDLNDVVRRTVALRAYQHATLNITVSLTLDDSQPLVWGNSAELQQVLLNLVLNAEHALTDRPPPRAITLRTESANGTVRVVCADTGPGIDPEALPRVFDPFYTTKPTGGGTGLGLSICYGIVRNHNGEITVESAPGRGTTFTVTLPRDARSAIEHAPAAPPPVPAATGLRVLIVDDEEGVREVAIRYFTRRGIEAVGVADGEAALAELRRREFDVVVTDVRMPGMSGREFVERLRQERPALVARMVIATGDAAGRATAEMIAATGAACVEKPFNLERLEALVRETSARATAESRAIR